MAKHQSIYLPSCYDTYLQKRALLADDQELIIWISRVFNKFLLSNAYDAVRFKDKELARHFSQHGLLYGMVLAYSTFEDAVLLCKHLGLVDKTPNEYCEVADVLYEQLRGNEQLNWYLLESSDEQDASYELLRRASDGSAPNFIVYAYFIRQNFFNVDFTHGNVGLSNATGKQLMEMLRRKLNSISDELLDAVVDSLGN